MKILKKKPVMHHFYKLTAKNIVSNISLRRVGTYYLEANLESILDRKVKLFCHTLIYEAQ